MQSQLQIQRADLLAVTECCNKNSAVCIAECRCFQQREAYNALACINLKGVCEECVVLVPADFHLVGILTAVIYKLCLYAGLSDQSIQMSRSSNSNLARSEERRVGKECRL